ncbi:MAG: hypothetical protein IPI49_29305 [Myxococcales bacterium]|nr:hypothetical protein [Myxococcales bacterium]
MAAKLFAAALAALALSTVAVAGPAWAGPGHAEDPPASPAPPAALRLPAPPAPPPIAPLSIQEAAAVLYAGQVPAACAGLQAAAVAPAQVTRDVIECMLTERYRKDRKAQDLALAFYRTSGSVAGVGEPETMDGGYRGTIRLVPQLTGAHRLHLARVLAASASFKSCSPIVRGRRRRAAVSLAQPGRALRALGGQAHAQRICVDWTVTYNVRGSLLGSADGVRETLFPRRSSTSTTLPRRPVAGP